MLEVEILCPHLRLRKDEHRSEPDHFGHPGMSHDHNLRVYRLRHSAIVLEQKVCKKKLS